MFAPLRRNVPVSLSLVDVDGFEAVAALSASSGGFIQLLRWPEVVARLPRPPAPELLSRVEAKYRRLGERTDFRWVGLPLADALRELCVRFALSPHAYGGAIHLSPQDLPRTERPPHGIQAFDDGRVRIYPRYLSLTATRSRWFIRELAEAADLSERDQLYISTTCELAGEDADRIAGFRDLTAVDDYGKRLEARTLPEEWEFQASADLGPFPDEWQGRAAFPAPTSGASRLASLTGDVMLFDDYDAVRVELPLPLIEAWCEVGPVKVQVQHYDPDESAPVHPRESPRLHGGRGPKIKAVIHKPVGTYLSSLGQYGQVVPVLLGAGGTFYAVRPGGTGISSRDDAECEIEAEFEPEEDRPARLIFDLVLKSRPGRYATFSLQDIPLP